VRRVVLDTNVLVSALLTSGSKPDAIVGLILNRKVKLCYDSRIMVEYEDVLLRDKFPFKSQDIEILLHELIQMGIAVNSEPCPQTFTDEDDRMFYEVAKQCDAILITGNRRHFPEDPGIMTPAEFLAHYFNTV